MEGEVISSFRESIHIDAPPAEVWRLVSDVQRHPQFAGPKSITKAIDIDGPLEVGRQWIAHERLGPQKFDALSTVTTFDPPRSFEWVSYPPMKDANRGAGGIVEWGYLLEAEGGGTNLVHFMKVLEPRKGAGPLKLMYAVLGLPNKQRTGGMSTLTNIKAAAEHKSTPS